MATFCLNTRQLRDMEECWPPQLTHFIGLVQRSLAWANSPQKHVLTWTNLDAVCLKRKHWKYYMAWEMKSLTLSRRIPARIFSGSVVLLKVLTEGMGRRKEMPNLPSMSTPITVSLRHTMTPRCASSVTISSSLQSSKSQHTTTPFMVLRVAWWLTLIYISPTFFNISNHAPCWSICVSINRPPTLF